VTSPTFTIGQRYRGRIPVSHLDLYRLDGLKDEDPALLDDYLDAASVAFIEWPVAGEPELAGRTSWQVRITHVGADQRQIEIDSASPPR
jgi:tRNA threonylcarbamoyladenosine biosynthesis protein TsaE